MRITCSETITWISMRVASQLKATQPNCAQFSTARCTGLMLTTHYAADNSLALLHKLFYSLGIFWHTCGQYFISGGRN